MSDTKCYLYFEGYYAAASASDRLTVYQIRNRIVKAPIRMRGSCSFAVMVDKRDADMCYMVLDGCKMKVICDEK